MHLPRRNLPRAEGEGTAAVRGVSDEKVGVRGVGESATFQSQPSVKRNEQVLQQAECNSAS